MNLNFYEVTISENGILKKVYIDGTDANSVIKIITNMYGVSSTQIINVIRK